MQRMGSTLQSHICRHSGDLEASPHHLLQRHAGCDIGRYFGVAVKMTRFREEEEKEEEEAENRPELDLATFVNDKDQSFENR